MTLPTILDWAVDSGLDLGIDGKLRRSSGFTVRPPDFKKELGNKTQCRSLHTLDVR